MGGQFNHRHVRPLLSAVLLCALSCCGGPSHEIVGKWRTSNDPNAVVWEFASNRLVMIGSTRGKYTFGNTGRIKIETPSGTSVYQAAISHDQMTFQDSSGARLEFSRVK
jgi:hypothetical protein